jgi:hypothetical protein
MPKVFWRAFRSRQYYLKFDAFRRYVLEAMRNEIAPDIISMMERQVSYWDEIPEFDYAANITREGLSIWAYPTTMANIWQWVSRGVEGHMIRPRRTQALKFRPKTSYSFGGYSFSAGSSKAVFSKGHWWPGIRPRRYEETVASEYNDEFRRKAENIMRRGIRRARQQGASSG